MSKPKPQGSTAEAKRNMRKFLYNEYLKGKKNYDTTVPGQPQVTPRSLGARSRPKEVTEAELNSPLQVIDVRYDASDLALHHTEKFELMNDDALTAIFRRGQSFNLSLHVNRKYDPDNDAIHIIFSYGGSQASYSDGTKYKISVSNKVQEQNIEEWGVMVKEVQDFTMTLEIHIPVKSQVGLWFYRIDTLFKNNQKSRGEEGSFFYALFNPWCKYDEVYLESDLEKQNYVLTDYGYVLGGTIQQITPKSWIFGQFDYSVLPTVFMLLVKSTLPDFQRGNVALMAREIAALINSNDEGGLLVGNWSKNRDRNTTPPEWWTGSVKIYEEFLASNGAPVKYGQCWVYAGCVTTACRALGIPCRNITCYGAAHDADNTLTIDHYYNKNGYKIRNPHSPNEQDDSIWNYHCWNEVWFLRKDLHNYDGWQVIDATPQELSEGRFTLGPAPVKAVHEGDVGVLFDVDFVFSEVNADICELGEDSDSTWGYSIIGVDTSTVGQLILTSDFDSENVATTVDLTNFYKYPEGSTEERETYYKAISHNPRAQMFYKKKELLESREDIDFQLSKVTSLRFGDGFDISLYVRNKSDNMRTVQMLLQANAVDNTGQVYETIKHVNKEITLQPLSEKTVRVGVVQTDYQHSLRFSPLYEVKADCDVVETRQVYRSRDFFEIFLATLVVTGPEVSQINVPYNLSVSWENPLDEALTNCTLIIEGPRIQRPKILPLDDVPPRGTMNQIVSVVPRRMGQTTFVAVFTSDQLGHISGKIYFEVLG